MRYTAMRSGGIVDMYLKNETVLYGSNGLCRVSNITKRNSSGEEKEYYALNPIKAENTTIFIPVESAELVSRMKRMVSCEEIREIFRSIKGSGEDLPLDERKKLEVYKEILDSGDVTKLIHLIRSLYTLQKRQSDCGKKLRMTEEKAFKDAQKLLVEEIALILNLNEEQAVEYIIRELEDGEKVAQ